MNWPFVSRRGRTGLAAAVLLLAGLLAYANSFAGAFVFDDEFAIVANPRLGSLSPWTALLSGPPDAPSAGRPVVALSLALNHALGGKQPWGYHAFNLSVHLAAALLLFGLVRRGLALDGVAPWLRRHADAMALAVALLWTVHPLQTESVTYVSQRAESLMAAFFLATLYALLRSSASSHPRAWQGVAVAASCLSVGSKEVGAMAPLVAVLFDRAFLSGSFAGVLRRRGGFHAALAATTWMLFLLLFVAGAREAPVRVDVAGLGPLEYARTQCSAILHYLGLVIWPETLVLDYGMPVVRSLAEFALAGSVVLLLLLATLWSCVRWPRLGFLAAAFFLVLAPSSSVVPIVTETMSEHRMYLPLAAVLCLLVFGAAYAGRALAGRLGLPARLAAALALTLVLGAALALTARTQARNRDYRSERLLWEADTRAWPHNFRSHFNLARALRREDRPEAAIPHYDEALRLHPGFGPALLGRSLARSQQGDVGGALADLHEAVRLHPDDTLYRFDLGLLLLERGRHRDAARELREVVRLAPEDAAAHALLASALRASGRPSEAKRHLQEALRLDPELRTRTLRDAQPREGVGTAPGRP
jgi:tetratricopeptide (TPR) repeat protein